MTQRHFRELLEQKWSEGKFVCVGLDSALDKLPEGILRGESRIMHRLLRFNVAIVNATHDIVCAYKPNLAFYLAEGVEGLEALRCTIGYIHEVASSVPVILDCKDADIGNTNQGYVDMAFSDTVLHADAITTNPYLGQEALKPFLDQANKGVIVLCRTSNPGAGEFQDLEVAPGEKLYERVARNVATEWNTNGNCGLVVGATYPEELRRVREIAGDLPILIPGIGKQGGDLEASVKAANGRMIINSSRGIIFASKKADFAGAARRETLALDSSIRAIREAA